MTRTLVGVLFLLNLSIISCCKDKTKDEGKPCESFTDFHLNGSTFEFGQFQFRTPHFNPINSKEFVYNYLDTKENKAQLMTYNLVTKMSKVIAENVFVISQPKWSRKNWIAYDNLMQGGYQMSVVKSDGSEKQQLTQSIYNLFPAWGNDGETLYWVYDVNLGSRPVYLLRQNINSIQVDTIMSYTDDGYNGLARYNEISSTNKLLHTSSCEYSGCFAKTDLNTWPLETESLTKDLEVLSHLESITWGENEQTVYYTKYKDGLYRLDASTGETTQLMDFCDSKFYRQISYSSDCHCIIGERVDSYVDWSVKEVIYENSSIWLIDLNTMKETQIIGD